MDFYRVVTERKSSNNRSSDVEIYPDFVYNRVEDLVCKGGDMYAYWFDGRWNTDWNDLITIIDNDIRRQAEEFKEKFPDTKVKAKYMNSHRSKVMETFKQYTKLSNQSTEQFNTRIIFSDEEIRRDHYATAQLPYTPSPGPTPAFDEMFERLYSPHELEKIMWFIGALLTNSMAKIEKFMFLYGRAGSGKGTVIKVMMMLFEGYFGTISLHTLTSNSEFATSQIREVPLLIDADADLSKISNDTNLLKLTAHEPVNVNMKYKQTYDVTFKGLLVAASNQRYRVRNVDSGITRRAVVVEPTKYTHSTERYFELMEKIKFELPHIAQKAIDIFTDKGPFYYEDYVNVEMSEATDHVYSFVREHYKQLGDPTSLKRAAELYKLYLEDIGFETRGFKRIIKEELKRYYFEFADQQRVGDNNLSNVYSGFKYNLVFPERGLDHKESLQYTENQIDSLFDQLQLKIQPSIFDELAKDYPAQYTNQRGTPMYKWDNVDTTLKDIDTRLIHYVQLPHNHIIIDFDIKDKNGERSLEDNLRRAMSFPTTYTEISRSGKGVHLHYIYDGDPTILESLYEEDVEVKVFTGKSALRRRVTRCNNVEVAHISSGLPTKKKGVNVYQEVEIIAWNERKMRTAVKNNLAKKYHANTKPSMDFIAHIFDEAEKQGLKYDLRDLRQDILIFATTSTNQSSTCIDIANKIRYTTIDEDQMQEFQMNSMILKKEDLYFYDIEIYPNLFILAWKRYGKDNPVTVWVNPTPEDVESIMSLPLVGFNNRRYDNHILYSRLLGSDNLKLYQQSQRIINKESGAFYGAAYELSYADIYEYNSSKKSLKKWMVDLDLPYDEMDLPWDQPIDESLWDRVGSYCSNDVLATEAVFDATIEDYTARVIMAELSGLSVNSKTQDHAAAFIFGGDKNSKDKLVYTDLSETFPGYTYSFGKSEYRGENPSEGGYVYAEPGIYSGVAVLDIVSMHPNSAINLNYFGPYTPRFKELVDTRVSIKHGDYDKAKQAFNGVLSKYLRSKASASSLAYSLKIIINIVYGMTSAKYENPFRNKQNVDNIVAKRGALFMIDLKHAVQEKGFTVVHIKTDSIKIPGATKDIIKFVHQFGKKYGYEFEHEATYEKFALINDSVYIARHKDEKDNYVWTPVGERFADPYVFKTMFTKQKIFDEDFALVRQVAAGHIYHGERFIGRLAKVYASITGDNLWRVNKDTKAHVTKTKGYLWGLFNEYKGREDIDMRYYTSLLDSAYKSLKAVGDPSEVTDYIPTAS